MICKPHINIKMEINNSLNGCIINFASSNYRQICAKKFHQRRRSRPVKRRYETHANHTSLIHTNEGQCTKYLHLKLIWPWETSDINKMVLVTYLNVNCGSTTLFHAVCVHLFKSNNKKETTNFRHSLHTSMDLRCSSHLRLKAGLTIGTIATVHLHDNYRLLVTKNNKPIQSLQTM